MNVADLTIILFGIIFALFAFFGDPAKSIKSFFSFVIAFSVGSIALNPVNAILYHLGLKENIYSPLIVFIFLMIVIWASFYAILSAIFRSTRPRGIIYKIFGLIVGFLYGVIFGALLWGTMPQFFMNQQMLDLANNSLIAGQIKSQSALVDFKSKYLESISQRMARALIVPSESSTQMRLELPKNISSSSSKELSDQIFDLTNQARADKSLPAYVRDDRLDQLANLYAVQIIATGNFSHRDQNGLLPDQRAKDYGITFDYIGENLAFAPSILSAQTGLMASTGHRANIESPVFRKMGVAVVEIQYFGDIVVEEFTN